MDIGDIPENVIQIRKEMLDDSNAAKEEMDAVKIQIHDLMRDDNLYQKYPWWPRDMTEPHVIIDDIIEMMKYHQSIMQENYATMDVNKIQPRWCCNESPGLFKERWEKLFKDFCAVDRDKFDPSKISELYDSLKYDALHNRQFLETVFSDKKEKDVGKIKKLYHRAKLMFDLVAPQEYGVENKDKMEIGLLTSLPLLKQVIEDLEAAKTTTSECGTRLYFVSSDTA